MPLGRLLHRTVTTNPKSADSVVKDLCKPNPKFTLEVQVKEFSYGRLEWPTHELHSCLTWCTIAFLHVTCSAACYHICPIIWPVMGLWYNMIYGELT